MPKSLIYIPLLVFSSSAMASASDCSQLREDELFGLLQRLKIEEIKLRGQDIEILALENEVKELNSS